MPTQAQANQPADENTGPADILITSLGEATIPADANTGQACRRVIAVGSSPAYHRLSHANT